MKNEKIRYFSMFSGVGGFELGIGKKGQCIGFSETDKYCNQLLKEKFPGIPNFGDATKIKPEELPDFDLLCGGFPCQAFSIAGKRKGFNDTRGTLFFEIARIIKVKRPKIVFLENVKGLLNHQKGQTFRIIIQTLSELGYDVQWMVLNSKFFGVPQNRERVFIIGSLRGQPRPEILPLEQVCEKDNEQIKEKISSTITNTYWKGWGGGRQLIQLNKEISDAQRVFSPEGIAKTLKGLGGGQGAKTGLYAVPLKFLERNQKNLQGEYSFTIDSANTGGVKVNNQIRRLTPLECERLQGFPDNWTEGFSDTQRYKMMGNAVTVNVVKAIIKRLFSVS